MFAEKKKATAITIRGEGAESPVIMALEGEIVHMGLGDGGRGIPSETALLDSHMDSHHFGARKKS